MITAQRVFFFLIGALLVYSCIKEPDYPNEPSIQFSKVVLYHQPPAKDSVVIEVTFQDGNGDLGLDPSSTVDGYPEYGEFLMDENGDTIQDEKGDFIPNKFHNNYFIDILKREDDGTYSLVYFQDSLLISYRFPILNELMNETALEGELRFTMEFLYGNDGNVIGDTDLKKGDIIKFEVQIADRAKMLSNKVLTDSIVLGEPQIPPVDTGE